MEITSIIQNKRCQVINQWKNSLVRNTTQARKLTTEKPVLHTNIFSTVQASRKRITIVKSVLHVEFSPERVSPIIERYEKKLQMHENFQPNTEQLTEFDMRFPTISKLFK